MGRRGGPRAGQWRGGAGLHVASLNRRERLGRADVDGPGRNYEAQIRNYRGSDPLEPWDRYLQWAEECVPLQEKQSRWPRLLEELVKVFVGDKRYHQDPRFVSYCVKLAEFISSPCQYFEYLHGQGIGAKTSDFYLA